MLCSFAFAGIGDTSGGGSASTVIVAPDSPKEGLSAAEFGAGCCHLFRSFPGRGLAFPVLDTNKCPRMSGECWRHLADVLDTLPAFRCMVTNFSALSTSRSLLQSQCRLRTSPQRSQTDVVGSAFWCYRRVLRRRVRHALQHSVQQSHHPLARPQLQMPLEKLCVLFHQFAH